MSAGLAIPVSPAGLIAGAAPFGAGAGMAGAGMTGAGGGFGFEIPQGNPGELERLASASRSAAERFSDYVSRVQAGGRVALESGGGWQGDAAAAFSAFAGDLVQALSTNAGAADEAAGALANLARALSHAQQVTSQALAECQQMQSALSTQRQAAAEAGARVAAAEQQLAAGPHPPEVALTLHDQAAAARGDQSAAEAAANHAEGLLQQARRRGIDAYQQYEHDAHALAGRIAGSAAEMHRVQALASGRAPSLVSTAGGTITLPSGFMFAPGEMAAGVPSPFDIYSPGNLLSAINEAKDRRQIEAFVAALAAGAATSVGFQDLGLRKQISDNVRRLVQLDSDLEQLGGPGAEDALALGVMRAGAASENVTLTGASRALRAAESTLQTRVAGTLLAVSFVENANADRNLTEATTDTGFSFAGALAGAEVAARFCPAKTPWGEGACTAVGTFVGAALGQKGAIMLRHAEDAVNRQLESAFHDVATPVGGGGLLSGESPMMSVNAP